MNKQLNTFSKTILATTLALGLSSFVATSAFAEDVEMEREIQIISNDSMTAQVSIVNNGDVTEFEISTAALHDIELLKTEIADLPQESQDIIVESFGKMPKLHRRHGGELHQQHEENVMVVEVDDVVRELEWISEEGADGDNARVVVIEMHDDNGEKRHIDKQVIHRVMRTDGDHVFIKADGDRDSHAKAIQHMLSRGKFSTDELDQIQQALDAKR
ncbi:hypothetical protein [Thalassotalea sp. ND16A]|uniref:hypothetical protein n=1 Tax=Thalassotalea sp. ND16A TaxID=1535422 RepID=UPI00051A0EB1|nr:hypothetical protein [Thalassotalea sp. ND16A]KGJ98446.1 hypothetical protein ND16A_0755 [Thalassotalea sp. ND16A]